MLHHSHVDGLRLTLIVIRTIAYVNVDINNEFLQHNFMQHLYSAEYATTLA